MIKNAESKIQLEYMHFILSKLFYMKKSWFFHKTADYAQL